MKKIIILFLALLINVPAFASGIGYINYDMVVEECSFVNNTIKEIAEKENEIKSSLQMKEKEFAKLESPLQKQKFEENVRAELAIKEKTFNDFRMKKEENVYNRIHAVSEKIRLEKGYDAILDARSIFSGGEDITRLLIQKLNSAPNLNRKTP